MFPPGEKTSTASTIKRTSFLFQARIFDHSSERYKPRDQGGSNLTHSLYPTVRPLLLSCAHLHFRRGLLRIPRSPTERHDEVSFDCSLSPESSLERDKGGEGEEERKREREGGRFREGNEIVDCWDISVSPYPTPEICARISMMRWGEGRKKKNTFKRSMDYIVFFE